MKGELSKLWPWGLPLATGSCSLPWSPCLVVGLPLNACHSSVSAFNNNAWRFSVLTTQIWNLCWFRPKHCCGSTLFYSQTSKIILLFFLQACRCNLEGHSPGQNGVQQTHLILNWQILCDIMPRKSSVHSFIYSQSEKNIWPPAICQILCWMLGT